MREASVEKDYLSVLAPHLPIFPIMPLLLCYPAAPMSPSEVIQQQPHNEVERVSLPFLFKKSKILKIRIRFTTHSGCSASVYFTIGSDLDWIVYLFINGLFWELKKRGLARHLKMSSWDSLENR